MKAVCNRLSGLAQLNQQNFEVRETNPPPPPLDSNPALLGFDADIKKFCGGSCDTPGYNILNMFGHIPYNMCRNFEWQALSMLSGSTSPGGQPVTAGAGW